MVSIIVTHKKDLAYLQDCFESIAEQQFTDYETILVVDHSEDDLQEIISAFQNKIHLKVHYLEEKSGVSAARNLGIKKASGEYIYFLDNDDYLYGETIKNLLDVMDDDTDMAYGWVKHTWFGRKGYQASQKDAENQDSDTNEAEKDNFVDLFDFNNPLEFRLEKYRKLDKLTVLGAIYKKTLFTENDIRFDEEQTYYADGTVALSILKVAKSVKCNEESLYIKRFHNDKLNNPALSQFTREDTMPDFFRAYKECVKIAGDDTIFSYPIHLMYAKFIVKEYIQKLRWAEDDRWAKEYYKGLVDCGKVFDFNAIKNKNFKGKRFSYNEKKIIRALVNDDFEKMKKASLSLLAHKKLKKMLKNKRAFNKAITLHVFNKMKLKENYIVFESFVGRNCSGQPKYIYKYLQENYGNQFTYIWSLNKKIKIPGKHKTCKRGSLRYYYYMNRSKYWVNNMRQPLSLIRRPETIMLSTWHGTPLKRLVFDMEDVHSANPKYKEIVYKQTREWDYLISDNPFSTEKFQSCFLFEKEKILEYGYPANDPLYAEDREIHAEIIKEKLGIPKDKKVIFYAPTWRDDNFYQAGEYRFDLPLDIEKMKKSLGDEYVLLLRMHYFIVDQLDLSKYGDFTIDGGKYDDITDLYLISDILITDYSSVFFDYANLKRPILYFTYDLEKYRDVLRGFYLDMEKDLPGPLLMTDDEVIDAIKNIDKVSEEYQEKYDEFYERFCCIDDGHAAKRVVEKVFGPVK